MDVIFSLNEIDEAAKNFWGRVEDRKVFAFSGQMGAGKTTFIQAACRVKSVTDHMSSPTFSIINQYKTNEGKTIHHIDLYRLKNEEEAIQAGVEDCLYSGNICFVEWPELAPSIFPADTVDCSLEWKENNLRRLKINL